MLPLTALFGPTDLDATGQSSGSLGVAPIDVVNNWSQAGYDGLHQAADPNDRVLGHHLSISPQTFLSQAWSFNVGSAVAGSVAVTNGLGFFADAAGEVFAVNMETGRMAWKYSISDGDAVDTTPAVTQTSLVLVASTDGTVTALHEFSGTLAWTTKIGGKLEASPSVVGGTAYVGSDDGTVAAVDVSTGSVIWSKTFGAKVQTSPALDPGLGLVIIGTSQGTVSALHLSDGTTAWTTKSLGSVTAPVVIGQGNVYVSSLNDTLYALNESTGASVWTYVTAGPITASVADVQGNIVVGSSDGQLHYLTPATGTAVYGITLGQPVVGVAGADNFVASVGSGGAILGSKPAATNPRAWTTTLGTAISAQPTVVNGEVVESSLNGMVAVYTPPGSPAY